MFGGSCQRGIRVLGIIKKKEGVRGAAFGVSICLCARKRRHENTSLLVVYNARLYTYVT